MLRVPPLVVSHPVISAAATAAVGLRNSTPTGRPVLMSQRDPAWRHARVLG